MTTFRRPNDHFQRLARARLYLVLGDDVGAGSTPFEVARAAVDGGAAVVQVRLKGRATSEVTNFALRVRDAIGDRALLIVNDDVDAALAAGADGVHVGQGDLALAEVRRRCGDDVLVGLSTHSRAQAIAASDAGADAIGIGAMFATDTKAAPVVIGPAALEGLADALGALPIFPIGGITERNVVEIVRRGIGRAAVSRAVTHAPNPRGAAERLVEILAAAPLPTTERGR